MLELNRVPQFPFGRSTEKRLWFGGGVRISSWWMYQKTADSGNRARVSRAILSFNVCACCQNGMWGIKTKAKCPRPLSTSLVMGLVRSSALASEGASFLAASKGPVPCPLCQELSALGRKFGTWQLNWALLKVESRAVSQGKQINALGVSLKE